ncbi:vitamin B12 ABC transporter substrate-binding protein BtuF [Pantoea sp. ICBG 1758]|uniref:vitamin B12 ABC transporter substrate-binding protein BtuF n=2 Tax=Erwiniaceae TaxID=1903409 RepID=UPI000A23136C|nr:MULTISPECIES: vitamin B12 ABC transporter substrate-binding protein BtuF [Pantoea]KAA6045301.1 vitamin B12 ABC transporter substrate-binding protein BtuF [Pantoea sp. Bo_7]KAA6090649.1 vitamin B12 ABC transporter substrate-binding protein BtuF [Pantoea sp. Bo_10]NIE72258.1 vitamin B12 ABC transporter substrate-binding protein BtuF [Pantoea sp. Acro-807]ORM76954.1 vitamin B12 ABC transporter substrate-binding protein BtuF [Pantoea eucrina]PPC62304.1 vitamin B12 ABC transporter substrate-bind
MAKWLLAGLLLLCSGLVLAAPRVITLAPHLTEMAFAAGITPVAVSAWSDYPPAARTLPQVANWQGIGVEQVLQLKPDVVLAWRGGNPARQIEQLQHAGVRVVWIDPQSLDEMIDTVQSLARWSPRPEQAVSAAQALRAQEAALRQRYRHAAPVALFLQFGQQPLFTASRNTLQNEIVTLCGGQNIFADSRVSWPQVSREQVLIRQPQAIVISGDTAQAASITRFWRSQLSVPVIAINPDWLSRPGPRLLLAAQQLCAALHPLKK